MKPRFAGPMASRSPLGNAAIPETPVSTDVWTGPLRQAFFVGPWRDGPFVLSVGQPLKRCFDTVLRGGPGEDGPFKKSRFDVLSQTAPLPALGQSGRSPIAWSVGRS